MTISRIQGPEKYPLVITEETNYIKVNATMFSVDFYKGTFGYNKLYNQDGSVLVYDDRIVLEYLFNAQQDTWKPRGTPQNLTWTIIDEYNIEVVRHYDDFLGTTYQVKYKVTSAFDFTIKITVDITCGATDTYRLNWYPTGITKTDYELIGNSFKFGGNTIGSICYDWDDVLNIYGDHSTTPTGYQVTSSVSSVTQGRKADIFINIGQIASGQHIVVDPITRVQGNARGVSSGSSIAVTMSSTPINGNVLIAVIGTDHYTAFTTVSSITQTGVNWSTDGAGRQVSKSYNDGSSDLTTLEIWLGIVGAGASTSITVTLSATPSRIAAANICEYSGVLTTTTLLDKTASNSGLGESNGRVATTGTTAATSQAVEVWIGGIVAYAAGTLITPLNGFTLLDGAETAGASNLFLAYFEKIVSSTGTASTGCTIQQNNYGWSAAIATFKAAAEAPSPTNNVSIVNLYN